MDEVIVLPAVGVEGHHVERQPRGHGTRVVPSRYAVRAMAEVAVYDGSRAVRAAVGSSYPVVEVGREEGRLVVDVVVAMVEERVQAPLKGFRPATHRNESRHVVGHAERVFPRAAFVEERVPPRRVPRTFRGRGRIDVLRLADAAVTIYEAVQPVAFGVARQDEAP